MKRVVRALSNPTGRIRKNVAKRIIVFCAPIRPMSQPIFLSIMPWCFFLGGLDMIPGFSGSTPRARAGRPSVSRFTQRSCIGSRIGSFRVKKRVAINKTATSARLLTKR